MSVLPFRPGRAVVVSPYQPFKDEAGHQTALRHLFTKLNTKHKFTFDGGIIKIRHVEDDILKGKQYWGGFGVAVLISDAFNGASFSKAMGENVVVYDQVEKKLYQNGQEKMTALVVPLKREI